MMRRQLMAWWFVNRLQDGLVFAGVEVTAVSGPYRILAGQVACTGATVGQVSVAGRSAGQVSIAGAIAGAIHGGTE